MTLLTIAEYLFGRRDAILRVASTRTAVWVGLLFVLSAGFAREYDGEDLLHEPWHLLIPVAASLGTSFLLFGLLWAVCKDRRGWSFLRGYRSFLGLYWMTAPLAWLYAIPVERWLDPAGATRTNLLLLGIVSAWRVALMIRVVSVLFNVPWWKALFPVMLFADSVALSLLFIVPLPVVSLMGGIRLSESEQIIQQTAFMVGCWGGVSWPVWLLGTIGVGSGPGWTLTRGGDHSPVGRNVWWIAAVAVGIWAVVLPFTQPEQQLRHRVELDLSEGRLEQALETMSAHERSDFPPHWDPPPRIGYGETRPGMDDVLKAIARNPVKPWVHEIYVAKFVDSLSPRAHSVPGSVDDLHELDAEQFDKRLGEFESYPRDARIWPPQLRKELENPQRTEKQKSRIRRLLGGKTSDPHKVMP